MLTSLCLLFALPFGTGVAQEAKLRPAVVVPQSAYGRSLDAEGDRLIVGAPATAVGANGLGSAWVYVRNGTAWDREARLLPVDALLGEAAGAGVAVFGDRCVVGAPRHLHAGSSGAVYVFTRTGTLWSHEQEILRPDSSDGGFGGTLAFDGDRIVVGSPDTNSPGRVYVFVRSGTTWSHEATLMGSAGGTDRFGGAVDIHGDRIVVGAWEDSTAGNDAGAVYVYLRSGTTWTEEAQLTLADAANLDNFGTSVAIHEDALVAGVPRRIHPGGRGIAVRFERLGGWTETARLVPFGATGSGFGEAVAMDANTMVVGAPGYGAIGRGYAFVFRMHFGAWREDAAVIPREPGLLEFGHSVALELDRMFVGAPEDPVGASPSVGSAFVMRLFPTPVQPFCDGFDGALDTCPCANPGFLDRGCDNAQGTGGVDLVAEQVDTGAGTATLVAEGYPINGSPSAVVMRSPTHGAPQVFGDGVVCFDLGGVVRLAAAQASAGLSLHPISHAAGPGTFFYHAWYRNTPVTFCDPAAGSNTSDGIAITW